SISNKQSIVRIDSGRPDCDISLTELLIGLLAVAFGPKDRRQWAARYRNPPTSQELEAAFRPLEPALMLDGDGARFFQDREALAGEINGVEALFIDAPGGNTLRENADHFVKRGRTAVLSRAGAAIALATLQTSAPLGGAGHRTSLRGGGPLTTLVVPGTDGRSEPTLWQRLWTNVPYRFAADAERITEVFPWLVPTRISDKGGRATTPNDVHQAQVFFGMPRRIRLAFEENSKAHRCDLLGIVDDIVVTGYVTRPWGTNYTGWSRAHPLSPYYKPRPADLEFLPLHLQSSRVGYRDWLGMVVETPDGLRVPAQCLDAFRERAEELGQQHVHHYARLLVAGYAMDNMKPLDFAESLLPLIFTTDAEALALIKTLARKWVRSADLVANQLFTAVRRALYGSKGSAARDSTLLDGVRCRFWADTEELFYGRLRDTAGNVEAKAPEPSEHQDALLQAAGAAWLGVLRHRALRIFDDAAPIESADSDRIADIVEGRKLLGLALAGHSSVGKQLFGELSQPAVSKTPRRGREGA
ncbi:MAG TPA: type I-E CRISPR-associated protein Cse1/CasA, partial [Hyphomicrobiaceae bacterium]|nr:type I-E CRISPR-associated protein Cse1/CasA [Hyphomicrobiaceae bacterium]